MTDSTPHWLPERHLGVAATLSHADELIGQVGDLLFAYQTQADGVVGLREVPAGSFSRTVVGSVAPIPRKVPLLVADALVALRAALEHALFAEVEFLDGAPLDEKAARLVEMPASDTYDKFEEWTRKQLRNRPPSLRAGSELVRRIDRLQPFHRQSDPRMHPLARLVLHTNHAKHRTPAITAVRLAAMYQEDQTPRSVRDLPPRPEEPLRVGDVIAETPIGTIIPVTLFPTIGINRPGTDRWPVLMQELDEISHWVRTQAVPRLVTGTEPPEPALPPRYEIAVGHQDERRAMSMGSTTSAADRQKQRLGAAVVRTDLVDLIGQVDGSPSDQQITAWLAQLTDEDVLDRMSRLKVTHTYDPGVMLHNVKVLEGLRDEALGFLRCGRPVLPTRGK
ncbi:hypothetical protein O7605_30025 [Verrucosispora sp. WMMA2121]|uniref:hypothetical protein n=1 Tax=Verrucosispora sp. WMMA2121 TaxID=3015164 RepID=UPI0022B6E14B|nr:hypothetical protein [Verrucosispora sp. WMMA2121]MCZ7423754.1 hypothetical protein [Verrucosispora sp. WMMA2121]